MQKALWSVNALSVEFELDRRTIAKRLNGLAPAKVDGQSRLYYLSQVLPLLQFSDRELGEARLPLAINGAVQDFLADMIRFFLHVQEDSARILACLLKERTGCPADEVWETVGHYFAVVFQLAEGYVKREIEIDFDRHELLGKMASPQGRRELNRWLQKLNTELFSRDYIRKDFEREQDQQGNGTTR